MYRFALVGAFVMLLGGAAVSSAAVQVPGVTLVVTPSSSTGVCPRNIDLRATLHWVPAPPASGSDVRYQFMVDGSAVAPPATVAVPAVGVDVHQAYAVTSAKQGAHTVTFGVLTTSAGPPVIDGETRFTASCMMTSMTNANAVAPGGNTAAANAGHGSYNPGQTTGAGALNPLALPAPYDLRRTTDTTECFAYGGGGHCTDPQPFREAVLIWEWKGNANYPAVDGYRFYQKGHSTPDVDIPVRLNQQITWDAWGKPVLSCFYVTAYVGTRESSPSNTWCIAPTVQQVQSIPSH